MSDQHEAKPLNTLKIGVKPRSVDQIRDHLMDIVSGRKKMDPDAPRIWFQSISQVADTLNVPLIQAIRRHGPADCNRIAEEMGADPVETATLIDMQVKRGFVERDEASGLVSVPFDEINMIIAIAD